MHVAYPYRVRYRTFTCTFYLGIPKLFPTVTATGMLISLYGPSKLSRLRPQAAQGAGPPHHQSAQAMQRNGTPHIEIDTEVSAVTAHRYSPRVATRHDRRNCYLECATYTHLEPRARKISRDTVERQCVHGRVAPQPTEASGRIAPAACRRLTWPTRLHSTVKGLMGPLLRL